MNDIKTAPVGTDGSSSVNSRAGGVSWFEAMAEAWGKTLDKQADRIVEQSAALGEGLDKPADVTRLQAEAQRMQFMSNASHTTIVTVGSALDAMARRQ